MLKPTNDRPIKNNKPKKVSANWAIAVSKAFYSNKSYIYYPYVQYIYIYMNINLNMFPKKQKKKRIHN